MANDNKADKFRASYQFFLKMQTEKKCFSNDDIAAATGWSSSTIKTYKTKKWSDILIPRFNKLFFADVSTYTEEAYVRIGNVSVYFNENKSNLNLTNGKTTFYLSHCRSSWSKSRKF